MREFEDLLPTLEPPLGGLLRLQRQINARRRRPALLRAPPWARATALVVPVLVLALWIPHHMSRPRHDAHLTRALQQAMAPSSPAHGIRVLHGAAIRLPGKQSNVRLYLVQTAPVAMHKSGKPD